MIIIYIWSLINDHKSYGYRSMIIHHIWSLIDDHKSYMIVDQWSYIIYYHWSMIISHRWPLTNDHKQPINDFQGHFSLSNIHKLSVESFWNWFLLNNIKLGQFLMALISFSTIAPNFCWLPWHMKSQKLLFFLNIECPTQIRILNRL